jgi:hypothetical protein
LYSRSRQVRRGQQGVLRSGADARHFDQSVGSLRRLLGASLHEGRAPDQLGCQRDGVFFARLSPPERVQSEEVSCQSVVAAQLRRRQLQFDGSS